MHAMLFVPDKDNFNLQKFVSSCFQISISYSFNFRYRVLSDIPRSCAASFRLPWFFSKAFTIISFSFSSSERDSSTTSFRVLDMIVLLHGDRLLRGLSKEFRLRSFIQVPENDGGGRFRFGLYRCVLFCMMSYTRCFKSFMSFFMSKSILYRISRSVAKL